MARAGSTGPLRSARARSTRCSGPPPSTTTVGSSTSSGAAARSVSSSVSSRSSSGTRPSASPAAGGGRAPCARRARRQFDGVRSARGRRSGRRGRAQGRVRRSLPVRGGRRQADQSPFEVAAALRATRPGSTLPDDLLLLHVGDEAVERMDPLGEATLEHRPTFGCDHRGPGRAESASGPPCLPNSIPCPQTSAWRSSASAQVGLRERSGRPA